MTIKAIDIKTFKEIPVVISGNYSHTITKGTIPGSSMIWFRKEMKSPKNALLEILAQEFFRLIIPSQPETRLARNLLLNTYYILSEEVPGFRHLPYGQQTEFNKGTYHGLGQIALVSIFVQEIDLKNSNVGLNNKNQVVKIDGDWSFVSINSPETYNDLARKITPELLKNLPYPEGVYTFNWLGFIEGALVQNRNQIVDKNLARAAHYRNETNQAILKILLLPDSYIKSFVDAYMPIGSSADRFIKFMQGRREELKQVALKDNSFQTYLASQSALDDVREHLDHLKGFVANGSDPIINPSQFSALEKDYEQIITAIFPVPVDAKLIQAPPMDFTTPLISFLGNFPDGAYYKDVNTGVICVEKDYSTFFKDNKNQIFAPHPEYKEMMVKEIQVIKASLVKKNLEASRAITVIQHIEAEFSHLNTIIEVETLLARKWSLIREQSKKIENIESRSDVLNSIELKKDEIQARAEQRIETIKHANTVIQRTVAEVDAFQFNFGQLNSQKSINIYYAQLLKDVGKIAQNLAYEAHRELNCSGNHPDIQQAIARKQGRIDQSFETLSKRFEILAKINFDVHLKKFADKLMHMRGKSLDNNPNYNNAINELNKFYEALVTAKIRFLHEQGSNVLAQKNLANNCQMAIDKAKPILKEHREWKGAILKFIMDVISFLTFGLIDSQLSIFSSTHSHQILNNFENETSTLLVR